MNKAYILLLAVIGLTATSCNKFLDLAPESNANAETFYKTTADLDLAINAAYSTLYKVYDPEGSVSYTGEMMGDNSTLYIIAGNQTDKFAFKDYDLKVNNTLVYSFWQTYYKALYSLNIVISKVEASDLPVAYKENAKAQMMFLRGLYYFNMVRLWGDVPIVTTPLTVEETYAVLRSPKADVYQLILSDLKYAAEKLPPTNVGRATKGAALTALGEVYLTLQDKTNAATALMTVFTDKQYKLQDTYASVFGPNVKNTKESVFEIQYLGGGSTSNGTYSRYYSVFYPNVNLLGFDGSGMNQITDDLYDEFETGDPRREVSISLGFQNGSVFQNQKYPQKWSDPTAPKSGSTILANNNFMVYRYADVLLMLSEATADPTYLNLVRERAGLPLFGSPGYPAAKYPTLELAIEHERRVELATEFHRWFDLKRTNRAIPVLTAKGKPVNEGNLLLPVPETVRIQNNAITQNPGYLK